MLKIITPNLGCRLILSLCICCVTKHLKYKDISAHFDALHLHKAKNMNNPG